MKRSILRAFALCLTTAFLANHAFAQNDSTKPPGAPGDSTSPYGTQGTSTSSYSSQAGQSVRLSKLMNTSLRSQAGESLGQVPNIIADPTSGQVQFVVLSLSSSSAGAPGSSRPISTGIGTPSTDPSVSLPRSVQSSTGSYGTSSGKLVAIPWRLLSHGSGDQFTATVDRGRLESAPAFSSASWPKLNSAWMQRVYSHFGVDATGTGAPGSSSGTGTGLGNPATPGLPSTPGTPDITPPSPGPRPGTTPGTTPGTSGPGTGTPGTGGAK